MSDDTQNSAIEANYDKFHTLKEKKYGFRTVKDTETGVETKRATIEVKLPVLSVEGIVDILRNAQERPKELELLLSAIESIYDDTAKSLLADDASITADNFPFDKLTWNAIANQPEAERRGRGIPKEVWEDFIKSYIAIMPSVTGKAIKLVEKQAAILAQKLNPLRAHEDKDVLLPKFKEMLGLYMNAAPDAENFQECIVFLIDKADKYLSADKNANLAANLGFD